jgi:hypothetical protein
VGGTVIVHRCAGGRRAPWRFQGDAVARPDAPVPDERLIGRVIAVDGGAGERRIGRGDRALGAARASARTARRRVTRVVRTLRRRLRRGR